MVEEDAAVVSSTSEMKTSAPEKDAVSNEVSSSGDTHDKDETSNEDKDKHDHDDHVVSKEDFKKGLKQLIEKKRRIMFTDAAVAIAMTLLILPLMDAAVDAREEEGISTLEWFQENKDLLWTFVLSYMVIAMAWMNHDRLFRTVSYFTKILSGLNFLWLLAIAFLPVATNIMNGVKNDPLQSIVWIGTMLLARIFTFLMTIVVHRNPGTWKHGGPQFPLLLNSMVAISLLVLALVLSITPASYWIILISILKTPITRAILWKWPSLKTKWENSAEATKNGSFDDKKQEDTSEYLKDMLSCLLSFRDRFDGLMATERRIIFTDAAAAIALTLLVLPLMDAATEVRGEDISTAEWFQENKKLLLSFFLSYLVIILLWGDQDNLFRKVAYFTRTLSALNFLWLLAIVFIPVATAVLNLVKDDPLQHFVYIGTPLLAKIWTFLMTIEVHRNPGTWEDGGPKFRLLLKSMVTIILLVLALVLSMTAARYWSLLILILATPITWAILWKWPGLNTKW